MTDQPRARSRERHHQRAVSIHVPALPDHVVTFLQDRVDHVVKLDFVLFLHDSSAAPVWIAASSLDLTKRQVRDMARELDGVVKVEGDLLELSPSTIEDRLAIADLASWYRVDRDRVIDQLRELGRGI